MKVEMDKIVLSAEAKSAVEELRDRLRQFSRLIKKNQEPETWGEMRADGVLIVYVRVYSSKGKVEATVEIPADHWSYKQ
ncbi:MAG: hypothetical protein Q8O93_05650 [bacterium]|nr:hypothetical protein [bacterium]